MRPMQSPNHLLFFVPLLLLAVACGNKEAAGNSSLDVASFEEAINDGSNKVILDVRTLEEFHEGHIRNATLIDFKSNDFKSKVGELDKGTPVYVYCASGIRSDKAAAVMKEEGFREVFMLTGGFNGWLEANKDFVK